MSANCDVIVIFLIYGQFGAIRSVIITFALIITFDITKSGNSAKNLCETTYVSVLTYQMSSF